MKLSKRTIFIVVALLVLAIVAWFFFFRKKGGDQHPSMKGWSEEKKQIFKEWALEKSFVWKKSQATSGQWPEIYVQADQWGLELDPAIRKHSEWEYDNGGLIDAYITSDWWLKFWKAQRSQTGMDENGF